VVGPGCFLVAALYWGVLYDGGMPSYNSINVHGLNVIVMIVELLLNNVPFRLLHVWCLGVFAAAYVVMITVCFEVAGSAIYDGTCMVIYARSAHRWIACSA
jgi:hypothetical protein